TNLNVEKALVVHDSNDQYVVMSAKNIPTVKTALTNTINVYDILKYNTVVVTKAAVDQILDYVIIVYICHYAYTS
ncbi:MAG: 50S ribosomal protein L4, partial [Pseudobutyrivibrio sp.]|nr:50S ribosomal protein L4 [Pseudobutyrivibrio sp.]